jgi:hypothetical protein
MVMIDKSNVIAAKLKKKQGATSLVSTAFFINCHGVQGI